jgi:hypothetical protein
MLDVESRVRFKQHTLRHDEHEYTLLGQWLDEVRLSRGERIVDACASIGIYQPTWLRARTPGKYLQEVTKVAFAHYLDVDPETVDLLWRMPADPAFQPMGLGGMDREDLSRLAQEIDAVRRLQGDTLEAVAESVGVGAGWMSHLRTIGANAYERTWCRIAEYVGCTVEQARTWAQEPPLQEVSYPQPTFVGTKYHPTVAVDAGCERCPFLEPCRLEVLERNGFAWCEDVIPVDLDPEYKTVSRRSDHREED